MPSHTKEPWHKSDYPMDNISGGFEISGLPYEDWKHAVRCVNGCTGLNPAAYRACVEALRTIVNILPEGNSPSHLAAKAALLQAEKQP